MALALGIWLLATNIPESALVVLSLLATTLGSPFFARFSLARLSIVLPVFIAMLHNERSLSSLMAFLILVTVMQTPGLLSHGLGSFLIAVIVSALVITVPGAIPALLLAMAFEVVSAVSARRVMNRVGLPLALIATIIVQVLNPAPIPSVSPGDMGVITCSLILMFLFIPALTHQSLVRIWAPLGIAVVHIFSEIAFAYGLCILALWCTVSFFERQFQSRIAIPIQFFRSRTF